MTLVVADGWDGGRGIFMAADSRITDPWGDVSNNMATPELKIVVVDRAHCIGYAGSRVHAIEALVEAPRPVSRETLVPHLVERSSDSTEHPPEFLYASLEPTTLLRVRHGQVYGPSTHGWVGDPDAFEAFQVVRAELGSGPSTGDPERDEFVRAGSVGRILETVASRDELPSVGEPIFTVRNLKDTFWYLPSASVSVPTIDPVIADGESHPVTGPQGPQVGSFRMQILTPPRDSGLGAIGVFYEEGQIGAVVAPLIVGSEPVLVRASGLDDFRAVVEQDFGLALH